MLRRTPARRLSAAAGLALLLVPPAAPAGAPQHTGEAVSREAAAALPQAASVPAALPGAPPFPEALRARLAAALTARRADAPLRTRHLGADGSPLYTNRLLLEPSPYLRQHAHNPVDWHPWGDEAFETARRLGRPLLVSIGYSTCHWCHVMEDESYDDPETAALLNAHFVAIKVDRELRPDVDALYMAALQALGEPGGWPLHVFVTPEREPFYGGTYFPPGETSLHGRPGFWSVLRAIHQRYREQPEDLHEAAGSLAAALRAALEGSAADATRVPGPALLRRALAQYAERFDAVEGGLAGRPKFPSGLPVRLLLRIHRRSGDARALQMATRTLEAIAAGGIHDQLAGGFHRYATDPRWRVPHFEKMLYDNALLALDYLEAWQATGRADFAAVVRSTLDYLTRELAGPEGGFASATDADSPGPDGRAAEGWYFTWTPAELRTALPPPEAEAALAYYGVREAGPVAGRSVLYVARPLADVARELGASPETLHARLGAARARLLQQRAQRPAPFRDSKVLAGWNGLAISALARAGFALDEPAWTQAAARAADFVLGRMRRAGRLLRVHEEGSASGPAFLEDYAFLIAALLDLYEAAPEPRWLREAQSLQAVLDARYADAAGGGYFATADDQERLLAREKPGSDGAIPSGNAVAALNLLRLHELTGESAWQERATLLFSCFHDALLAQPTELSELLVALDAQLDTRKQVVVVFREAGADLEALLAPLRASYVPNRVQAIVREGEELGRHAALVPLLLHKVAREGRATAYVCQNRVCEAPTTAPEVFARQLAALRSLE